MRRSASTTSATENGAARRRCRWARPAPVACASGGSGTRVLPAERLADHRRRGGTQLTAEASTDAGGQHRAASRLPDTFEPRRRRGRRVAQPAQQHRPRHVAAAGFAVQPQRGPRQAGRPISRRPISGRHITGRAARRRQHAGAAVQARCRPQACGHLQAWWRRRPTGRRRMAGPMRVGKSRDARVRGNGFPTGIPR